MKKLIAVFVAVATLGVYGFAAAHPDVTFVVTNNNNALVTNSLTSLATTGDNTISADQDVEDGEISTGNAETEGTVENDINQNAAQMEVNAGSDVTALVSNTNDALVTNDETLAADSGENEITAEQDVAGGIITTGNAKATGKIGSLTGININVASFIIGDPTSSCDDCTGVDDVTIEVDNRNGASVENGILSDAETGENEIAAEQDVDGCSSCGGGGALIDTGDATAEGEIKNDENQNETTGSVFASGDVDVAVGNNNLVFDFNSVIPVADTGANEISASEDVSDSTISTGFAKTLLKVFNRKNISITEFEF